jgi:hypothetical protein
MRERADVPLAVSRMIAGICLLDAAFIGTRGYVGARDRRARDRADRPSRASRT